MSKINERSNPGLFRKQMILEVIIVKDNFLAEKRESCSAERVGAAKPGGRPLLMVLARDDRDGTKPVNEDEQKHHIEEEEARNP